MRTGLKLLAWLLISVTFVACGSDDDDSGDSDPSPTPQGVQGQTGLCVDLALVRQSLDRVLSLDSSSTLEEAGAARDALNLALTELQQAGGELTTAQNALLQDSFETFNAELDSAGSGGASDREPLGEAAVPLKASAEEISNAEQEISREAGCPS
jgi:hypothetical protein